MKKKVITSLVLFAVIMLAHTEAFSKDKYSLRYSADSVIINRPVNIQGLTGLLFTNSAYTQPAGSVTIGVSALGEDSDDPNYSYAEGAATLTIGFTDRVEMAVKGKAIATNLGSTTDRTSDTGDTDLSLKWRFSSQGQTMPALAFGFGWTFPTGNSEKGFSEVKYEGIKLMVLATAENRVLDEGFFGIYMEAQAVFNDQLHRTGESPYKEKYGVINAGLLFPVSDDNNLQFLFEYNRVLKRDFASLHDGNYTGLTPGFRYVTENFNVTLGVQRVNREEPDPATATKATRLTGTMSYRF